MCCSLAAKLSEVLHKFHLFFYDSRYFSRSMRGYEETQICNSNNSYEAAKFYYENRYAPYSDHCKQPCGSMNVHTSLKYKIIDPDPVVYIIFPRYIAITNERFVHSFITLGKIFLFSLYEIVLISSC